MSGLPAKLKTSYWPDYFPLVEQAYHRLFAEIRQVTGELFNVRTASAKE